MQLLQIYFSSTFFHCCWRLLFQSTYRVLWVFSHKLAAYILTIPLDCSWFNASSVKLWSELSNRVSSPSLITIKIFLTLPPLIPNGVVNIFSFTMGKAKCENVIPKIKRKNWSSFLLGQYFQITSGIRLKI